MLYEVHTFGGGEYLYDIFSGVAALTTGNSYSNILKISALFGLTWALLMSAFSSNFQQSVTWFIGFMLMYNVMFVPKATVLINDPLNKMHLYREVPNVPFALAFFSSYSSTVGNEITKLMESAFTPVDYLPYHEHGMLFGSKLISASTSLKIVDEEFSSNLNSFIKQCVFYDLLLHKYSIDELKNTDDIWSFLTVENQPSQARSFAMSNKSEQRIVSCRVGAAELKGLWDSQIDKGATLFGHQLFPNKDSQSAKKLFMNFLPISYAPLLGVSKDASALIKQNMMINAIDRAGREFSNNGLGSTNVYMAVRSNLQTKAAFSASKRQAEEWVPILKVVFEVLFYGAFPLIFLLFLLPIGAQVAKGYFITFIWLQSWAPLYAILNRVMVGQATLKSSVLGGYGLTIATQGGIEDINQNVALMAGYLAWSIPFIAAGLAKGTMAVTGLSTSMLAIPQSAANNAASEASTGNLNLGNTNLDNISYNNTSGNKLNDSMFFDSARIQAVNFSGGMTSMNADGRAVYDQTGSVSRIPNLQLSSNDTQAQSATLNATVSQSMGENLSKQSSLSKSKSIDQLSSAMASHSINENHGIRFAENTSAEVREAYSRIEQEANELSHNNNIDKTTAFNMALNGNLGFGSSGSGKGAGVSIASNSDSKSSDGYSESEKVLRTNQKARDIATISNAIRDRSLELSDSHGNSLNESYTQQFSEAQRFEEQSRAYFDSAKSFSEQAQMMSSQSLSFTQDQIPEFIEYAKSHPDLNGNPLGERALSVLAENPAATEILKNNFVRDRNLGQHLQSFNNHKNKIGVGNVQDDYISSSNSVVDPTKGYDQKSTRAHFQDAVIGKRIDNSSLDMSTSYNQMQNKVIIKDKEFDSAGVSTVVKERLEDGAITTQLKSIKDSFKDDKNISNFDTEMNHDSKKE